MVLFNLFFLNKINYPANCIKKNIILKGIDNTNPITSNGLVPLIAIP